MNDPITANRQIALPRKGDALELRNDMLFILDNRYKYAPHWLEVRLVTELQGSYAEAVYTRWGNPPFDIKLARCVKCGSYYARDKFKGTWWARPHCEEKPKPQGLCRSCTRVRDTAKQRVRRKAGLTVSNCARCGASMVSQRTTKRYCGGRCRVAVHRHQGPV